MTKTKARRILRKNESGMYYIVILTDERVARMQVTGAHARVASAAGEALRIAKRMGWMLTGGTDDQTGERP